MFKTKLSRITSFFGAACLSIASLYTPVQSSQSTMLASWYGPGFHGRLTANGEVYDQMGHTAASPYLPFGTKLLVCYDKCTTVRINDRGPYIGVRELDLSYGAANHIGLIYPGVAYITVSYL